MPRRRNERAIAAALVLSVLVHLAVFFRLPPFHLSTSELTRSGDMPDELSVRLIPAPRPSPPRPPVVAQEVPRAPALPRATAPRARPSKPAPPPRRPVLAMMEPSAPAMSQPAPPTTTAPPAGDLASYIESRRRARGETAPADMTPSAPSVESANARASRLAAANIAVGRDMTFGYDPKRSGGVFSVQRMSYDYAEFMFYGWNREARRNLSQLIAVQKGNASDIRIAVVHKMIAIIREYEQGDFVWESERLGRNVTLSARPRDTAGLEAFLMREFFPEWTRSAASGQGRP